MKAKISTDYFDTKLGRYVKRGEVIEISKEQRDNLESKGIDCEEIIEKKTATRTNVASKKANGN